MFGTFFKSSLKALPVLVLLPVLSFFIYELTAEYFMFNIILNISWLGGGVLVLMRISMIMAIVINFVFVMIIPSAMYGLDSGAKRKQFYLGFFLNILLMLVIPIFIHIRFGFESLALVILVGFSLLSFLIPFIIGAKLVTPAYKRVFWF